MSLSESTPITTNAAPFAADVASEGPVVVAETATVVATATVTGTAGAAGTGALADDSDTGGLALSVSAVSGGTVGASLAGAYGHLTLNADGSYCYVADMSTKIMLAALGAHLVDTFNYTVSDTGGATTAATLTITLDRAPVAAPVSNSAVVGGAAVTGNVLSHDTDPDGDSLTVTAIQSLNTGSGTIGTALAGAYGSLTIASSGAYTYTPDASISAPAGVKEADLFNYTESDGHGGTSTAVLIISIDRPPLRRPTSIPRWWAARLSPAMS